MHCCICIIIKHKTNVKLWLLIALCLCILFIQGIYVSFNLLMVTSLKFIVSSEKEQVSYIGKTGTKAKDRYYDHN